MQRGGAHPVARRLRLLGLDARLIAGHVQSDAHAKASATLQGIGPLTASARVAGMGNLINERPL